MYLCSEKFSFIYLSTCPASAQNLEQIKNKNICFHVSCQIRQAELHSVTTQKPTEQSFECNFLLKEYLTFLFTYFNIFNLLYYRLSHIKQVLVCLHGIARPQHRQPSNKKVALSIQNSNSRTPNKGLRLWELSD